MKKFIIPIGLSLLLLSSCNTENSGYVVPNEAQDIVLTEGTRAEANRLKDYYLKVTTDVIEGLDESADNESGNVILSPLSLAMALAMEANGVEDNVSRQITDYLGIEDLESLNELMAIILKEFPKLDNQTDFRLANSAWVDSELEFSKEFSDLMIKKYSAAIGDAPFSTNTRKAIETLNRWCSKNTSGLIPNMFDNLSSNTVAVLLNTLNFSGLWKNEMEFRSEATAPGVFKGSKGETTVDMMYSGYKTKYYFRDDDFESFKLYFGNGSFSLQIVLPAEGLSLDESLSMLTEERMNQFNKESVKVELAITLPKFKVNSKMKLGKLLAKCGIPGLMEIMEFEMLQPLKTGFLEIRQGVSFEIDEKGVKAVSVTSGEDFTTCPPIIPGNEYWVKVDRPFYFFLREVQTGAYVLSGRISNL